MLPSDGGGGDGRFTVDIDALSLASGAAAEAGQTLHEVARAGKRSIHAATHSSGSHAVTEALRSFSESWMPVLEAMAKQSAGLSKTLTYAANTYGAAENGNAAALRQVTGSG